jgi:hypothetical protein
MNLISIAQQFTWWGMGGFEKEKQKPRECGGPCKSLMILWVYCGILGDLENLITSSRG